MHRAFLHWEWLCWEWVGRWCVVAHLDWGHKAIPLPAHGAQILVGRAAISQRFAHLHDVRVEPHIADKLPRPHGLQQFLFTHDPVMPRHEVGQHLEHFGAQWYQDPGVVQLIALGIKMVGAKHIVHTDPFLWGHGTALALVTVFGTLADGSERLISAKTLRAARASNGRHTDLVLGFPLEFGLGFGLSGPEGHFGPNPAAFGHDGFGGSAVGADPEAGVAFAYVMNRMGMNLVDDPRKMALITAVYESLASS